MNLVNPPRRAQRAAEFTFAAERSFLLWAPDAAHKGILQRMINTACHYGESPNAPCIRIACNSFQENSILSTAVICCHNDTINVAGGACS